MSLLSGGGKRCGNGARIAAPIVFYDWAPRLVQLQAVKAYGTT